MRRELDQSIKCNSFSLTVFLWLVKENFFSFQSSAIVHTHHPQVHGCGNTIHSGLDLGLAWFVSLDRFFGRGWVASSAVIDNFNAQRKEVPMSTEQQKVLDKAAETSKSEAGFVLTKSGVMFVGSHLLGDKLAAIMCEIIERDDLHGLACLTIRDDNFPIEGDVPVFGVAFADTNSVAINLEHCWHRACVKASKNDVNLSFVGILWVNILNTLAHELDHLIYANGDRELYEVMRSSEDGQKELEESAQAAAAPILVALAKQIDIEPPIVGDLGWFGAKFMDLFTNESTRELEWVIKARKDMEAGIMYAEPENEIEINTFREFVKTGYENDGEGWDQPTTCVNLIAYLDSGAVEEFKAEPVEAPVVDAVELEADKPAEEAAPIEMTANATGTFVGAGANLENGEPDIVMADGVDAAGGPTIDMVAKSTIVDTVMAAAAVPIEADGAAMAEAAEMEAQAIVDAVEVPLPAPVAAQQAALVGAAATGAPPVVETPTTYTPNGMDSAAMSGCMSAVWKILYHHMFTKCGWQQNPQTGRFMFTNAAAILEGVNIQHILAHFGADNFIMEYDTLDAEGKYAAEQCQGMIRGRTTSKQGLPSYTLYLNIGGQRIKRSFIPQNPEKKDASNAYTKSADEAGAGGHMIVWVFKDEVPDSAPFKEKCAVKMYDNNYEVF